MRFRPRLTFANVIATLSLFVALGGISYAATKLPKNSVGTKQIKNKAVTKAKLNPKLFKSLKAKTGPAGKDSPPVNVLNADGSVLGTLAGVIPSGLPIFQVLVDDGLYTYYPSGQVIPITSFSPVFKTSSCDGTAYIESTLDNYNQLYSKLVGGPTRVVFRTTSGTGLGPISAWKLTATHETVAAVNVWELNTSTGACVASGTSTGELITLEPVPAPPDGIGPLKISS